MAVVETGVHTGFLELLVPQGADEEVPVGDGTVDHRAVEGGRQLADRLRAGGRMGDDLGQQGS
ncbi:hypothetical protein SHKM778_88650 [Streptomyces sp. KM77-8]|uniref:Uncharacterized protein n=1 Tax=Streptomyces haneummycinicus TaxID=3074435 RepID=A0AAT9HXZ4_9ACTN